MSLVLNDEMAEAAKTRPTRKMNANYGKYSVDNRLSLKECGVVLIQHVVKEYKEEQNTLKAHVNEILHSIFFLGMIFSSPLTPEDFLSATMFETVRQEFPEPFDKYKSHLPKRTPFSILLDMMQVIYKTTEKVMEELCNLLENMKFPHPLHKPGNKHQQIYTLESTVICVCFNSLLPSKKHFGASLGCKTGKAKEIMIYSSCINTWHEYVSYAVMSFTQTSERDGLKFPESLRCQAYLRNWQDNTYEKIPPCKNCKSIFSLPGEGEGTKQKFYPFGNCAETECLSKLLFHDPFIQENTEINNYTNDKLTNLKDQTKNKLRQKLDSTPFNSSNNSLPVFNPDS